MKQTLHVLFIQILFLLFVSNVQAQIEIRSELPPSESLVICGDSAEISFVVRANGTTASSNSLEINMLEGIQYANNSLRLTSVGSKNVSFVSWSNQILRLSAGDLGASDSLAFAFMFHAECEALTYFQHAITITDTLTFDYNGGSQVQHVTQALNSSITYPQLSVLIPTVPSGALGEAISRDIKIFNAQSCISSFEWMEIMDSDVSIDSVFLAGTKLATHRSGDTISYTFTSADFALIGNGDGDFCSDELSFTLTEYLTLSGCVDKNSEIQVSWGCNSMSCQSYSANTDVNVDTDSPDLTYTWRNNELPSCYHEQANYKEVLIQNIGDGIAKQVEIEIKKFYYGGQFSDYKFDGIDTSTVVRKVGNGSFEKYTAYNVELNYDHVPCSENYVYRFTAATPDLNPGDSVVIGFYVINCDPNESPINTDIRQGAMGYNYRYQNACETNLITGWNKVGIPLKQLTSSIVSSTPASLLDGESATVETTVQTMTVSFDGDGQFMMRYVLPSCGIDFSGNSSDVTWTSSDGSMSWTSSSFSYVNDTILATFDLLSKPNGLVYSGSVIRLDVEGVCGCTGPSTSQMLGYTIDFIPEISCTNPLSIAMVNDSSAISVDLCNTAPCDGPRLQGLTFERVSYGLADNGYSRQPDYVNPVNLDTIRTDRARYGDTLMVTMTSLVEGTDTFSYGYSELRLDLPQYFTAIGGAFKLYKSSTGTYLECDTLMMGQSDSSTFQFYFSPDTLQSCNASFNGVRFEPGDSLFCYPTFVVSGEGSSSLTTVTVSNSHMYVQSSPSDTSIACGGTVYADQIQLVKMEDQTIGNYLLSNSCDETRARSYIRQYVSNDKTDIFFGEYRTWNYPDSIYVTPPDDFDYVNSYLLLRFNPIVKDAYLSPIDSTANPLVFPVSDLFDDGTFLMPDDGYELEFSTIWQPSCNSPNDSAIEVPVPTHTRQVDQRFIPSPSPNPI